MTKVGVDRGAWSIKAARAMVTKRIGRSRRGRKEEGWASETLAETRTWREKES